MSLVCDTAKKVVTALGIGGASFGLAGCGDPYVDPVRSKAISEAKQTEEVIKQTALEERQTRALERIADKLDGLTLPALSGRSR